MKISKNQFLFIPKNVIAAQKIEYSSALGIDDYQVYCGELCKHTVIQNEQGFALLLGYVVDAKGHELAEQALLESFLWTIEGDSRNVADCVRYWGGRWCLIYRTRNGINVVSDTCGLKQVFYYTKFLKGGITVASQARYIAEIYYLEEDKHARSYIVAAQKIDKEYSWPLNGCLYERVKRLLPNHILKEGCSSVERMPVLKHDIADPASEMTQLLSTQMSNIQKKGKSAVTLTAGWDSRMVLAAADKKDTELIPVTLLYIGSSEDSLDVRVSREICDKVGLQHKLVRCSEIRLDFEEEYCEHGEMPHEYWMQMNQAVIDAGLGEYYWVKGSCNEVLRASSGVLYNWQVSAKVLCKLFGLHYNEYSDAIISKWVKEARPYCKQYGIGLLDLFYWEHRCGSWLAECLNESDIAGEMFSPFNCRAYIEAGLKVPYRERVSPYYKLFKTILEKTSFDLSIPINQGRYNSAKSKLQCIIKNKLHLLYGFVLQFKPLTK